MINVIRRREIYTNVLHSFRDLESYKDEAQKEIHFIIHKISFENIFQRCFRIITGYNDKLLRQYMKMLDDFIVKSSNIIRLQKAISISDLCLTDKQIIIDSIESIIDMYNRALLNKENFKKNRNSSLIQAIYLRLDALEDMMKLIQFRGITQNIEKETIKETNIQQTTKGFIDIDKYMVDSFN